MTPRLPLYALSIKLTPMDLRKIISMQYVTKCWQRTGHGSRLHVLPKQCRFLELA